MVGMMYGGDYIWWDDVLCGLCMVRVMYGGDHV